MDLSVALVQAYLRVNGYFTAAEFPVVERRRRRGSSEEVRTATDVDILAFWFGRSRHLVPASARETARDRRLVALDSALGVPPESADMIVGELKEERAELNSHATDPAVLRTVLVRFGCCDPARAPLPLEVVARRSIRSRWSTSASSFARTCTQTDPCSRREAPRTLRSRGSISRRRWRGWLAAERGRAIGGAH